MFTRDWLYKAVLYAICPQSCVVVGSFTLLYKKHLHGAMPWTVVDILSVETATTADSFSRSSHERTVAKKYGGCKKTDKKMQPSNGKPCGCADA